MFVIPAPSAPKFPVTISVKNVNPCFRNCPACDTPSQIVFPSDVNPFWIDWRSPACWIELSAMENPWTAKLTTLAAIATIPATMAA